MHLVLSARMESLSNAFANEIQVNSVSNSITTRTGIRISDFNNGHWRWNESCPHVRSSYYFKKRLDNAASIIAHHVHLDKGG